MIANTIITAALRRLLVIPSGGTPTSNQLADGLEVLNDMVNSWSAQRDLIYEDTKENLTIPSGTQSITIGPTGDLITGRPLRINVATLRDNTIDYTMRLIGEIEYQSYSQKTNVSRPYRLYYRNTWPNGTIYFEYTTDKAYTLVLTSMKQLSTFPNGTTDIALPDYYERALKTNFTIEIADEMGAGNRVTATMFKIADEAKTAIISQAIDLVPAITEFNPVGVYNIEADDY